MNALVAYQLPDGRVVNVHAAVCRWASTVTYALSDGTIVLGVICAGQRPLESQPMNQETL